MKHLTLVRHAKSSWNHPELDDFDRPLNERGKHDAPMMAKLLVQKKVLPDLIISSPAKRAIKTARIIAKEIGYPKDKIELNSTIYEANVLALLNVIHGINDKFKYAMLFGHNPGFNDLGYLLTLHDVGNIPTCGILAMEFTISSWKEVAKGNGRFVSFDFPKKYY